VAAVDLRFMWAACQATVKSEFASMQLSRRDAELSGDASDCSDFKTDGRRLATDTIHCLGFVALQENLMRLCS
jgi:hypothetical protein